MELSWKVIGRTFTENLGVFDITAGKVCAALTIEQGHSLFLIIGKRD